MNWFKAFRTFISGDRIALVISILRQIGRPLVDALLPLFLEYKADKKKQLAEYDRKQIMQYAKNIVLELNDQDIPWFEKLAKAVSILKAKVLEELELHNFANDSEETIRELLTSTHFWVETIQTVVDIIKNGQ